MPGIPGWPPEDDAVRAVLAALAADGSWGRYHGPHVPRLIGALRDLHATEHVTLCCSGTIAVELALRGVGVAPGDEVLLAGYDFPGNFRAIEAIGARPGLVDIDPRTWCLDAGLLEAAIGPDTKAIVVSHLHGGLAAMRRIVEICRERNVAIVEDACQAPGALVDGRRAGTWGDAGVLSFGGSKLLTAGRGGAVLTNRGDVQQRIRVFAQRGNDAFTLSAMQAAVLLPQIARLDERNVVRRESVRRIRAMLCASPVFEVVTEPAAPDAAAYYKLAFLLVQDDVSRDTVAARARTKGIPLDAGFRGFATRGARRCRQATELRHSRRAAERTLLLHHPALLAEGEVVEKIAASIVDSVAE